jgi:mono/diheme cytochrome c family protein
MPVKIKNVVLAGSVAVLVFQWRAPAQDDSLGRQAQAILAESCYGCHGPGQQMAGLRLDTGARAVVTAGRSADSLLIKRVTGADGLARMPMGAPALSADKIATLANGSTRAPCFPPRLATGRLCRRCVPPCLP